MVGPGGALSESPAVTIIGVLQPENKDGSLQLLCIVMRNIRYSTNDSTPHSNASVKGTSTIRNPMPGPDDVLSFELPPITVPNATTTIPEQYSVRVRIR
jgi:hypothetical protein